MLKDGKDMLFKLTLLWQKKKWSSYSWILSSLFYFGYMVCNTSKQFLDMVVVAKKIEKSIKKKERKDLRYKDTINICWREDN